MYLNFRTFFAECKENRIQYIIILVRSPTLKKFLISFKINGDSFSKNNLPFSFTQHSFGLCPVLYSAWLQQRGRDGYPTCLEGTQCLGRFSFLFCPNSACSLFCFIFVNSVFVLGCLNKFRSMVFRVSRGHFFMKKYIE